MDDAQSYHAVEVDDRPTCRNCLAEIHLIRMIMDSVTGRQVRIFECCDCGQRTWDD